MLKSNEQTNKSGSYEQDHKLMRIFQILNSFFSVGNKFNAQQIGSLTNDEEYVHV